MKFGVIMHKSTQNIGDDIQSYAAARLLPSVDYFLDREHLDDFKTDNDEPVAVVMSAWYMWHKWNWPPSKYIVPLFVGIHYTDNEIAKQDGSPVKTEFLSGKGAEYLNVYAPVGCRDTFTEQALQAQGIDSYFSGCITLTLPKMPKTPHEREYVCCVDVSKEAVERTRKLLEGTEIELKVIKHYKDYRNSDATWEERVKNVTDLLSIYQNAKCVITRRLHCALPCLAMDVPVLVLKGEKAGADIRFEPYYNWMHCCQREDYISGEYDYDVTNPPENGKEYLPYREALLKTVDEFVKKYENAHGSVDEFNRFDCSDSEMILWRHDTMKDCMNRWLYVTRSHIQRITKQNKTLSEKENRIKSQNALLKSVQKEKEATENKLKKVKESAEGLKKQKEEQIASLNKQLADEREKVQSLKKSNSDLNEELNRTQNKLSHLENIVNCKSVRYSIKIRNAFVPKKKKIKY
ncbi:MAG: polysaccharide pyruvyl transferase family protein [Ruminococcus sp.]|nr:polysaccharide pyruvyl transferase family protein [Ruminococcus sp.]